VVQHRSAAAAPSTLLAQACASRARLTARMRHQPLSPNPCPARGSQELDRIQARGQSGAKSPLLWDEGQVAALLQGSPIVAEVAERLHVRAR